MPKKDTPKEVPQAATATPNLRASGLIPPFLKEVAESSRPEDFKIPRPTATPFRKGRIRVVGPKKLSIIILFILAVLGICGTYYFYSKYEAVIKNPNLEAQKETEALVLAVGKLIELPQDETPTIATVSDKEKLSDQPFFKAGENGDKLLTYTKAMKAVLYRPKTNKIINVAPIVVSQEAAVAPETRQNTSTPAAKKKLR